MTAAVVARLFGQARCGATDSLLRGGKGDDKSGSNDPLGAHHIRIIHSFLLHRPVAAISRRATMLAHRRLLFMETHLVHRGDSPPLQQGELGGAPQVAVWRLVVSEV
jgi:hypothetical protein